MNTIIIGQQKHLEETEYSSREVQENIEYTPALS